MKKFLSLGKFVFLSLFILVGVICLNVYAYEQMNDEKDLHTVIDVGTDIYVQHDSSNNDIYLLTSEGGRDNYL